LKTSETEILKALMSNPKSTDQNIAKATGFSQPTVTRKRRRFLETGIIESYEIIPNLQKLGFEILAFSTIKPTERVKEDNQVVYAGAAGRMMFVISVHRKYADYAKFYHSHEVYYSFLVPTYLKPMVPLSFKNTPF